MQDRCAKVNIPSNNVMMMLFVVDVANDLAHVVAFDVQREFQPIWASMKKFAECMMVIKLDSPLLEALSAQKTKCLSIPSRKAKN